MKESGLEMDFTKKCVALLLLYRTGAALEIFVPSTHQATVGSAALIPCKYTVEKPPVDPRFFAAFWHFQGKEILSYDDQVRTADARYSLNVEKALNGAVDLSISKISVLDAGVYTCTVIYSPEQRRKDITVHITVLTAPPQTAITDKDVTIHQASVLRCSVTGFYPEDIDIQWFRGAERMSGGTIDEPHRNSDGTYNVNSTVTITPTEEDRGRIFSCRVRHESLQEPLQEDFQLTFRDKNVTSQNHNIYIPIGIVAFLVIAIIVAVVVYCRRKNKTPGRPHPQSSESPLIPAEKSTLGSDRSTGPPPVTAPGRPHPQSSESPLTPAEKSISGSDRSTGPPPVTAPGRPHPQSSESPLIPAEKSISGSDRSTGPPPVTAPGRPHPQSSESPLIPAEKSISGSDRSTGPPPVTETQPDLQIGEITVPELILGKTATLECTLHNYKTGVHTITWYEKKTDTDEPTPVNDPRRTKDVRQDNNLRCKAYLALTPVNQSDHGTQYICRAEPSRFGQKTEKSTGKLHVTEQRSLHNNKSRKGPLSPNRQGKDTSHKLPEDQAETYDQRQTPHKETAKERRTQEPRKEARKGLCPVNESIHEEEKERPHKTSAEKESDELGEYNNSEGTQALKSGNTQGVCPANEWSGEDRTEDHSLPTNKPFHGERTGDLEERSTGEDEEELDQEEKEKEEMSPLLNKPFHGERTGDLEERSTGEDEEELDQEEKEKEEMSPLIKKPFHGETTGDLEERSTGEDEEELDQEEKEKEEMSPPLNKPFHGERTGDLEERSTGEDEEELDQEEKEKEEMSPLLNKPFHGERTGDLEERSTGKDEVELDQEEKEKEETSPLIKKPFLGERTGDLEERSTREDEEELDQEEKEKEETSPLIKKSFLGERTGDLEERSTREDEEELDQEEKERKRDEE